MKYLMMILIIIMSGTCYAQANLTDSTGRTEHALSDTVKDNSIFITTKTGHRVFRPDYPKYWLFPQTALGECSFRLMDHYFLENYPIIYTNFLSLSVKKDWNGDYMVASNILLSAVWGLFMSNRLMPDSSGVKNTMRQLGEVFGFPMALITMITNLGYEYPIEIKEDMLLITLAYHIDYFGLRGKERDVICIEPQLGLKYFISDKIGFNLYFAYSILDRKSKIEKTWQYFHCGIGLLVPLF